MKIEKYSVGIGDRFGKEGLAQLRAFQMAEEQGAAVVPGVEQIVSRAFDHRYEA